MFYYYYFNINYINHTFVFPGEKKKIVKNILPQDGRVSIPIPKKTVWHGNSVIYIGIEDFFPNPITISVSIYLSIYPLARSKFLYSKTVETQFVLLGTAKSMVMGNRRYAQLAVSEDEDEAPPPRQRNSSSNDNRLTDRKRKKVKIDDDDEEQEGNGKEEGVRDRKKKKKMVDGEEEMNVTEAGVEEEEPADAKPIGETIRVSGKGRWRRSHYASFEYDGIRYELVSSLQNLYYF